MRVPGSRELSSAPEIHICGRFVNDQYPVLPEDSSGEAHQLPLPDTEVRSGLCQFRIHLAGELFDGFFKLYLQIRNEERRFPKRTTIEADIRALKPLELPLHRATVAT